MQPISSLFLYPVSSSLTDGRSLENGVWFPLILTHIKSNYLDLSRLNRDRDELFTNSKNTKRNRLGSESLPKFQLKILRTHHFCPPGKHPYFSPCVSKGRSKQRAHKFLVTSYMPLIEENSTLYTCWD